MREARFIPLTPVQSPPQQSASTVLPLPPALAPRGTDAPTDRLSRPLRDLRISVTDRCNFRCGYCMPRTVYGPGHAFLPHTALLSFEEIERASRLLVGLGIHKIRLTGGEPLLRKQLDRLIATLAPLTTPQGQAVELTLTTNGTLLAAQAAALRRAGLHRVTISLDALDDPVFQRMNDAGVSVARVLDGIEAAHKVGLGPLKVNMVVQRGVNEDQIVPMARHFRHSGVELRYIEYMDVGSTNGWQRSQVLPSEDVLRRLQAHFSLTPLPPGQPGETARRYRHTDGAGQIGLISSVTQAFCGDCNRLRLSTDGRLYTCLFATRGHDLRTALRSGSADDTLTGQLRALWQQREDRYSQMRSETGVSAARPSQAERPIEMSYIGG